MTGYPSQCGYDNESGRQRQIVEQWILCSQPALLQELWQSPAMNLSGEIQTRHIKFSAGKQLCDENKALVFKLHNDDKIYIDYICENKHTFKVKEKR